MSSPTATAPTASEITARGLDFADWLSPILVKELRQGLKTRIFITTFILIQVVMILLTGLQLLQVANGAVRSSSGFSGLFAAFIWIPLIILMPARGLTAVSEEVKVNTLDLVQLTRLTAFRIVLGKWVALIAQTLLLVTAILPYAVLRYFFGEVDIIVDLAVIGVLLLASMVLTASALALSSAHLAVRILVVLVLLPVMVSFMVEAFDHSSAFDSNAGWLWMLPLLAGMYVFLLLEIAASRIAPISENHSGRKRLVVLLMGLVGLTLTWFAEEDVAKVWCAFCLVAACWVTLEALSERTQVIPSLYGPFARRGFLGRVAGRVFYPGWASAVLYTAMLMGLVFAILHGLLLRHNPLEADDFLLTSRLMFPLIFTSLVTPVLVILLFPRARQPVWLYILTQAMFGLLYVIASVAGNAPELSPETAQRWLGPFPASVLFVLMDDGMQSPLVTFFTTVTLPVCGLIILYLFCRAVVEFRLISKLEDQSIGKRAEPVAPVVAVTASN